MSEENTTPAKDIIAEGNKLDMVFAAAEKLGLSNNPDIHLVITSSEFIPRREKYTAGSRAQQAFFARLGGASDAELVDAEFTAAKNLLGDYLRDFISESLKPALGITK